jgi:hypothetical protein
VLVARGWIANNMQKEENVSTQKQFNSQSFAWGAVCLIIGTVCYFTFLDLANITGNLTLLGVLPFLAYAMLIVGAFSIIYGVFSWIKPGFVTAVALACYCGIIADHMLGNLIFLSMIGVVAPPLQDAPSEVIAGIFMSVLPISVAERILFTAIATTIGIALLPILRKAGLLRRKTQ